jgi:hypothetical protein
MATSDAKNNDGTGSEFAKHQSAVDKAQNEKIKSEKGADKISPEDANRKNDRKLKTDVSVKKTGGGEQVSPGD